MNQQYIALKNTALFQGIEPNEMEPLLHCMSATQKSYAKGDTIYRIGEPIRSVGLVTSGLIHLVKDDFWGNRSILAEVACGELFGETYACVPSEPLGVSVIATKPTEVLFLDIRKILTVCSSACGFHTRLIHNLLSVLAQKNLLLTKKMEHITKRNTREKLLSYLSSESLKKGSSIFEIPFNRQQLAEYLSVDRSAMSNELSKLREEGILEFHKNKFQLKTREYC